MKENQHNNRFTKGLLAWDKTHNQRKLVWQAENRPYQVWVRETLLQQTRLEQAIGYYRRFLAEFPSVLDLANAPEKEVFKVWEGVGYYNRCKNMLHTARYIFSQLGGNFPTTYQELIQLKGIGPYTAAAIMSFCYNGPYAVIDGNVERVVARYKGFGKNLGIAKHKQALRELAANLLSSKHSSTYNQAIMDFGATVCTPRTPKCSTCFGSKNCVAYGQSLVSTLPIKQKKIPPLPVYLVFLHLSHGQSVALQEKVHNALWRNLYLLPAIMLDTKENLQSIGALKQRLKALGTDIKNISIDNEIHTQTLSHRKIFASFAKASMLSKKEDIANIKLKWVGKRTIESFYFPVILRNYFQRFYQQKAPSYEREKIPR